MDLERPPAAMPDDLTMLDDLTARKYHSQFNALAARARYLRGLDAARARECDRARKLYLKPAMRAAREQLGKSATLEEVKALAEEQDEMVALWESRRIKHSERADAYGEFVHIYTENVTVLSRDYTMREKEQAGA